MRRRRPAIRWLLALALGASALGGWAWWAWGRQPADALGRGRQAYAQGDWEEADRLARQWLKAAANDPEGLRLLARASVQQGRDALAMSLYERLGEAALQAEDRYLLGLALSRSGKVRSAVKVWEAARASEPDRPETLFQLVRGYYSLDRMDEAAQAGELLAKRPGWEAQAEALLGMIALSFNDPGRAAAKWQSAVNRPPDAPEGVHRLVVPRKELARAWLRVGRPAEARDQLRTVLAKGPDPEASWLLSRVELQQKDWAASRADLERSGSFRETIPTLHDPSPYVGSASCAGCHPGEYQSQQASRHARTFYREGELRDLKLPASAVPDPSDAKVRHALHRGPDGLIRQETKAGGQVFDAVVQYAFGSGDRGLTLVGRDASGRAHELRLSDYPLVHGEGAGAKDAANWDVTSGHPRNPNKAEEYMGQPLTEDLVRRCLFCHVTDIKAAVDRSGPSAADHGIGCERCHGPAGNHLLAVEGNLVETDPAIGRPALASGARIVKICAECHSPRGATPTPDDPISVRFQGTTLTWSRCYTESQDAMDCITCHDPHKNATTSTAHYEARCLECHSKAGQPHPAAGAGGAGGKPTERQVNRSRLRTLRDDAPRTVCPVNPSTGCIGCHMPAVSGIAPHSTFTDHFIRVHRD
jgi:tetratricopeptide (TPR) repeat protein